MNWMEFDIDVECPHCGSDNYATASFDTRAADQCGVDSGLMTVHHCGDCDKEFWFKARLEFSLETQDVFKKKPKGRRNDDE